jgi:hypothetical protein
MELENTSLQQQLNYNNRGTVGKRIVSEFVRR